MFRPLFVEVDVAEIRDREDRQTKAFRDMIFRALVLNRVPIRLTNEDLKAMWDRAVSHLSTSPIL